jgi:hypothetical protein
MKKIFRPLFALALLLTLVIPTLADTIKLKDGNVIHGQVIAFKDGQFTVLIGSGSKGRRSRTTIYVEDIESIEFDNTAGIAANQSNQDTGISANTTEQPSQPRPTATPTREIADNDSQPINTQPSSGEPPLFFTVKVTLRPEDLKTGWKNSSLVVAKGQRIRVTASGRVSLGKDSLGRTIWSTPVGLPTTSDKEKLISTEATGALIAVIGDDDDKFFPIGSKFEFVAQRDGALYFGVNQGELPVTGGSYDLVIEAEAMRRHP